MLKLVASNRDRRARGRSSLSNNASSTSSNKSSTTPCPTSGPSSPPSKRSPTWTASVRKIAAQLQVLERICPSAVQLVAQAVAESLDRALRRRAARAPSTEVDPAPPVAASPRSLTSRRTRRAAAIMAKLAGRLFSVALLAVLA